MHKELCSGEVSGPSPLLLTIHDDKGLEFLSLKVLSIQVLIIRYNKHHTHTNRHIWKALDLPIVETTVPAKKKELLKSQLLSSVCDSFPTGYTPFWIASVRFWEGKQSLISTWLVFSSACCKSTTDLAKYCSFPVTTTHLSSAIRWHYSHLYLQGWVAASSCFWVLDLCPVYADCSSEC